MKRLMSGTVLLGAVLAAGACNNVTSDLSGNATRIIATPTFLIGDTAAIKSVLVQTFDDQGMPVVGAATVTGVTGTVTAAVDPTYRPGGEPVVTKIDVQGTGLGLGTFTATANGLSTVVNVTVSPPVDNVVGTVVDTTTPLMKTTPVVFTTPASQPYRFTSASQVFIGPASVALSLVDAAPVISADSLTATFIPNGARTGVVTVTGAVLTYNTAVGASYHVVNSDTVRVTPVAPDSFTAVFRAAAAGEARRDSLRWLPVRAANPYKIFRATTSGGPYTLIDSLTAGPTVTEVTYLDEAGLVTGTSYFYVVQACNGSALCSANSPQATATVTVPAAPTGLARTVLAGPARVSLTWAATVGNSYIVSRSTVTGGPYTQVGVQTAEPPVLPFVDATVAAATTYFYVVKACVATSATDCGANSAQVTAVIP